MSGSPRLEEQLEIITGLWTTPRGEQYSFAGRYYQLEDSPALPKPVQRPHPPVIIGGFGRRTTPRLAARFADEFNLPFAPLETYVEAVTRVRAACETAGRDPATLGLSVAQVVCCGSDEAEIAHRAARIGREVDELRTNGLAGTPTEIVDKVAGFAGAGAGTLYLQVLDLDDLDHLRLIAAEVMPAVSTM